MLDEVVDDVFVKNRTQEAQYKAMAELYAAVANLKQKVKNERQIDFSAPELPDVRLAEAHAVNYHLHSDYEMNMTTFFTTTSSIAASMAKSSTEQAHYFVDIATRFSAKYLMDSRAFSTLLMLKPMVLKALIIQYDDTRTRSISQYWLLNNNERALDHSQAIINFAGVCARKNK